MSPESLPRTVQLPAGAAALASVKRTFHVSEVTQMAQNSKADKAEGATDKAAGKLKEAAGKVTKDRELEGKGKAQQAKGNAKSAEGNLKDSVKPRH